MIYLDYNSTHPPFLDLIHDAVDAWGTNFANPSGISHPSQKNQARIERARSSIAANLNRIHGSTFTGDGVLFLSTGTEAVHYMIAAFAGNRPMKEQGPQGTRPRALLSPWEHESMYSACEFFGLDVRLLSGDGSGRVDAAEAEEFLSHGDFLFASVTSACNETGVLQPLGELKQVTGRFGVPLVSDSIQAAGKSALDLSGPDALILNGHKIGAGPGAAALLLRNPERFRPIFSGGLQEGGRRAGTENLPAISALDSALARQTENILANGDFRERNRRFHDRLESMLREDCGATIAGEASPRNSTTYAVFPAMTNLDFLLIGLDREGILCSTGSSCKSRARQPSRVLQAMGFSLTESLQALRFSTGIFTGDGEIERFCEVFPEIYRRCL